MAVEQQCVFCQIASEKIPAKKVYDSEEIIGVLDINPGVPGHVLLLPKKHVSILPQMDDEITSKIGKAVKEVSKNLIRSLGVDGTSIFVANGVAAGQRAPHVIIHVIPRKEDDGLQLQLKDVVEGSVAKKNIDKLASAVAKQFGAEPVNVDTAGISEETGEFEDDSETNEQSDDKKSDLDDIADLLTGGK
ncbi:hypothetical protein COV18_07575 [Candidatus Woesearchaeota archaeon CG10_big_fil_rev_8_21_14_0_10_37_12]|nr:MAG: hypothetical protein COV18_07575 [Candidatus Woesearchaeota archaeon CG10_big_fil_rev_8_21_14_0_10_37_12]